MILQSTQTNNVTPNLELTAFVSHNGVDLTSTEVVDLHNLLDGTPPTSSADKNVRADSMLAPLRTVVGIKFRTSSLNWSLNSI